MLSGKASLLATQLEPVDIYCVAEYVIYNKYMDR